MSFAANDTCFNIFVENSMCFEAVFLTYFGGCAPLCCLLGVEMCYELYSPRIQLLEVLKLEKRLDDNLMYLRDALPAYSTVDVDMKPVPYSFSGEVPVNTVSGQYSS